MHLGVGNEALALGIAQSAARVQIFIAVWALVGRPLITLLELPAGVTTARAAALVDPRPGIGTNLCHEGEYTIVARRFKGQVASMCGWPSRKGGSRLQAADRGTWQGLFRAAAARTLGTGFQAASCNPEEWAADELGQRRPLDRAFLRCILGPGVGKPEPRDAASQLWVLAATEASGAEVRRLVGDTDGSLIKSPAEETIETSTEAELAGLHAAWRVAVREQDQGLRERCMDAAAWSIENVQPDNATNRPWAAHVFIELWLARGDAGASLYAQTLLHNCQVSFGKPDRISALVLWDAAEELGRAR